MKVRRLVLTPAPPPRRPIASIPDAGDASSSRIPCAIYRAGTSKAVLFLESDLPADREARDRTILAAFGSPDARQIDGLGGADPLTSKVAYVGPSKIPGADVDYTFGYVSITNPVIDYSGNCGNIAAAVGPFALLRGLVEATDPITRVRINNTNTGTLIVAELETRNGRFVSSGSFSIDGVPGTGSKINLDFVNAGGSVTGRLLPTNKPREQMDVPGFGSLTVSIVDAGNPFVFVRGSDLGLRGDETIDDVANNASLLKRCELIRALTAERLGIASRDDAATKSPGIPKIALVSSASTSSEIDIIARMTALQKLHKTFAVTGAICLGAAAKIEGSIVHELFHKRGQQQQQQQGGQPIDSATVRIGHPSGTITVETEVVGKGRAMQLMRASLARTSRLLMDGHVHIPIPEAQCDAGVADHVPAERRTLPPAPQSQISLRKDARGREVRSSSSSL